MSYYMDTTKAGKTIDVYKYSMKRIKKQGAGKKPKEKPTPEEMEKVNQRNAERKLTQILNANYEQGDFHLILTYQKKNRPTPEAARGKVEDFLRAMRKAYKKMGTPLKYVNVTEYKKAAIHHHLVINHVEGENIMKLINKLWPFGFPKFVPMDGSGQYKELAEYLIKETAETFKKNDGGHKQRYSCSRNLIHPKPKTKIIKKANRWAADPKPIKGYYIDQDTVYNGVNPFTGREYQRYTMISLEAEKPFWLEGEEEKKWEEAKKKYQASQKEENNVDKK